MKRHGSCFIVDLDDEAAEEVVAENTAERDAQGLLEARLIEQIDMLIVQLHTGKGEGCAGRKAELRKVPTPVARSRAVAGEPEGRGARSVDGLVLIASVDEEANWGVAVNLHLQDDVIRLHSEGQLDA